MNTNTSSSPTHTCCGGSTHAASAESGAVTGVLVNGLLDVRAVPPARRHSLIFETYNGFGKGESFVLVNDHDPKPLYYQFSAEHAGLFTWAYEERGPETWRVRIGRTKGEKNAKN
ncbi:MAG: DUF2249 domain-containing protein [Verrucomicrobiota bacterium]|nr:DUF2249 domain-containing protein [Verrucomicrobiota bacterium]